MTVFSYRGGALPLDHTAVMGILNVTPDSFSDGGQFLSPDAAVAHALAMQQDGAEIIDVGGQSTRPGHTPISDREEWARLAPILEALRGQLRVPVSVDTYYPFVAEQALQNGAAILNDVSGSLQNGFVPLAKAYGAGLIMMHNGGNAVADARAYFETALALCQREQLPLSQVCLDIGVGFGQSRQLDLALIAQLPTLLADLPKTAVLCGASRKRVIADADGNPPPADRLAGTLALHTAAQLGGARILRAHDVREAVQAARVTDRLLAAR